MQAPIRQMREDDFRGRATEKRQDMTALHEQANAGIGRMLDMDTDHAVAIEAGQNADLAGLRDQIGDDRLAGGEQRIGNADLAVELDDARP